MKWSPQQDAALKDMSRFLRDPRRTFYRLFGDAGTGKTTLVQQVRDDHADLEMIALAYTGKAASRLRAKSWHNAATIHSKLTIPGQSSRARLKAWIAELEVLSTKKQATTNVDDLTALNGAIGELKQKIADEEDALKNPQFIYNQETELKDYNVLVIDEVSMIDWKIGDMIDKLANEYKIKVILMGDPWQLPPVKSVSHYMQVDPDFQLTEIHRQAKDDPILYLAQRAKNKEKLLLGSYGTSKVVDKLDPDECLACDQLLVGKNETRTYYNRRLRELRGYTAPVEVGEKLMCLMNNKNGGFFNGTMWYVLEVGEEDAHGETIEVKLASDDDDQDDIYCKLHIESLLSGDKLKDWRDLGTGQSMTSCQAATVHKFQGSEGKHIVLFDEKYTARADAHRWLYTGCTRAQVQLTVVNP